MILERRYQRMDVNGITQIISSVGFPIAACVALFWYMTKTNEQHKEETDKLKQSIDNNTLIITKLYERLGSGKNE